ncbi:MAG TPA: GDYXXLXY domain-containing protein [Kiritimatiellia bacterium]|nr:GDYXXLXY domain-containing protein [Kiritimatiellia bacterium]HRZ11069.1 GDYXXLXY domain-containing protein [Kiritimatiellia bacterium]HSA18642.1 GDYXXLXY domain-containing protein [Kiritimatiellia bacterium]
MNRRVLLVLFLAACVAQWVAATWKIAERELILRLGHVYKFKTAPMDPVDAFRGRYVAVRVEQNTAPFEGPWTRKQGGWFFAELAVGEDGFARFVRLHRRPPAGAPAIRTRIASFNVQEQKAWLNLPLDRFYMSERQAPEAERAYREHSRQDAQDAWLAVRVWRGRAAIENLYIGDRPILDVVR